MKTRYVRDATIPEIISAINSADVYSNISIDKFGDIWCTIRVGEKIPFTVGNVSQFVIWDDGTVRFRDAGSLVVRISTSG